MNITILQSLIELNADEWNSRVSEQTGLPVELLKNTFNMRQSLSMTEDKVKLSMNQAKLDMLVKDSANEYAAKIKWSSIDPAEQEKYIPPEDRFVGEVDEETVYEVSAFALTGKVVIGLDFTNAALDKCLFNGCTFFNCVFEGVTFDGGTFLNCSFNLCDLSESSFVHAQMSRCRFIDCSYDRAILDHSIFTDSMIISCQFIDASLLYTNFSYSGINESSFFQSNMRAATFCVSSIISTNLGDANLRNVKLLDVAMLRCNCIGTEFLGTQYNSISAQEISYDGPYGEIFEMSRDVFSPVIREWDSGEEDLDEFINDNDPGEDFGSDSFDDIMGNDDDEE